MPLVTHSDPPPTDAVAARSWLLYDGECPFCSAYVKLLRLRHAAGPVDLVDARAAGPEYAYARARGFDIDAGMLLHHGGEDYHGDAALNVLALMTTPSGAFNRSVGWLFKSPERARVWYPWLRRGRNLAIRLLGKRPLEPRV